MRLRVVADFDHKIELSDVCSDECASMGCGVFSCLNKILGIQGVPRYREFSSYANFLTVNFGTAVFQNHY